MLPQQCSSNCSFLGNLAEDRQRGSVVQDVRELAAARESRDDLSDAVASSHGGFTTSSHSRSALTEFSSPARSLDENDSRFATATLPQGVGPCSALPGVTLIGSGLRGRVQTEPEQVPQLGDFAAVGDGPKPTQTVSPALPVMLPRRLSRLYIKTPTDAPAATHAHGHCSSGLGPASGLEAHCVDDLLDLSFGHVNSRPGREPCIMTIDIGPDSFTFPRLDAGSPSVSSGEASLADLCSSSSSPDPQPGATPLPAAALPATAAMRPNRQMPVTQPLATAAATISASTAAGEARKLEDPSPTQAPQPALAPAPVAHRATHTRVSMKLHSVHPEQLQPGALAALGRLLLPRGWLLTGAAVRRGCIELVLDYSRVDVADVTDPGAAAAALLGLTGAAAERAPLGATPEVANDGSDGGGGVGEGGGGDVGSGVPPPPLVFPDRRVAELAACLHGHGVLYPALEPRVAVQVNQHLCSVQWQLQEPWVPAAGAPVGPAAAAAGGPGMADAAVWSATWGAGEVGPDAGAAGTAAAAGVWRCTAVAVGYVEPAWAGPLVDPACVVVRCLGGGPGSVASAAGDGADTGGGAVALRVEAPCGGAHSCSVRCLGRFLPARELQRLPRQAPAPCGESLVVEVRELPPASALLQVDVRLPLAVADRPWAAPSSGEGPAFAASAGADADADGPATQRRATAQDTSSLASWTTEGILSEGGASNAVDVVAAAAPPQLPPLLPSQHQQQDHDHNHDHDTCFEYVANGGEDPLMAAAPVLLLRACTCFRRTASAAAGAVEAGAGGAGCTHGCVDGPLGRADGLGEAGACCVGAWPEHLALQVAREVAGLRSSIALASRGPTSYPSSASTRGEGGGGGDPGLSPVAAVDVELEAAAAAAEFLLDVGLLLDAAARLGSAGEAGAAGATAGAHGVAHPDGGGEVAAITAAASEVHEWLCAQLGVPPRCCNADDGVVGGDGDGKGVLPPPPPPEASAPSVLRRHLADVAVTLLAGCAELDLPATACLIEELAVVRLRLSEREAFVSAAADGDAELELRLRALLQAPPPPPNAGMESGSRSAPGAPVHGKRRQATEGEADEGYASEPVEAEVEDGDEAPLAGPGSLLGVDTTPHGSSVDLQQGVSRARHEGRAGRRRHVVWNSAPEPCGCDGSGPAVAAAAAPAYVDGADAWPDGHGGAAHGTDRTQPLATAAAAGPGAATRVRGSRFQLTGPGQQPGGRWDGRAQAAAALARQLGRHVVACFTGFWTPAMERAFWADTARRMQATCRLYAVLTLAFVLVSAVRALLEDGFEAAAFMLLYQGGQAMLLAGFGLWGNGAPGRLFGAVVAVSALRCCCHALLAAGMAPLPSFVLPVCRAWGDFINEGGAKAMMEQVPLWLFAILMLFGELPTAYMLYQHMDGEGAGLLTDSVPMRLVAFAILKTAVTVGAQAVRRMRFSARQAAAKAE